MRTHSKDSAPLDTATVASPLGLVAITADRQAIHSISFAPPTLAPQPPTSPLLKRAERQLQEYFAGERDSFDLPLAFDQAGSPFQQSVWRALAKIPFGSTTTYGSIAAQLGQPRAARAVGMANHVNPWAIVIPCHRVIGANGRLVGYAGGIHLEKWLLEHESAAT